MSESNPADTDSTDPEPAIRRVDDTDQTEQPTTQRAAPDDAAATSEPVDADEVTSSTDETDDGTEHPIDAVPDRTPQTFEAAIEASWLEQLLGIAEAVVDECRLHLDEEALYIRAVDPANAAMADITVSSAAFETYESSGGRIGINLDRLDDVLSLASNGDLVQFTLDPATRKLTITIDMMEVTLALIDPESIRQEPDLTQLELPATVIITADDLERAIKAGDMVSDHLRVSVDPVTGCFRTEASGDTDDVRLEIDRDDCEAFDIATTETVTSLYSLKYLKDLCRPLPTGAPITLAVGDGFPLDITFTAVDSLLDGRFLLAPRLQTD